MIHARRTASEVIRGRPKRERRAPCCAFVGGRPSCQYSALILPARLKMGRYIAMSTTPTVPPMPTIITGSMRLVSAGDRDVDLFLVEVGDLVEHGVERAGLLADADHLHDHRREDVGLHERLPPCSCPRRSAPART